MSKSAFLCWGLLLFLIGCGTADRSPSRPDSITIAVPYEIDILDPHAKPWLSTYAVSGNFYEPLVGTDYANRIQPRLAASWENPDSSTWIFHLQPSVTFHSGKPFEAEDVVFTLKRLLENRKLSVSTYLTDVVDVQALNRLTVQVRTRTPLAIFLNKLNNVLIVPRNSTDQSLANAVDGTGPYKLVEWKVGQFVQMTRNDQYWGNKPALKDVTYLLNRNPENAVKDLVSGRCQFAQYNYKKFESIMKMRGNIHVLRQDNYYLKYLSYDVFRDSTPYCEVKPNPFKNKLVRQAIQIGIDRKNMIDDLPSYAVPATQPVPPFVFGFNRNLSTPEYNLRQAKALLAQAGFSEGFAATMFVRQILQETGVLIQQQLAKLGIQLELRILPDAEFFEALERQDFTFFLSRAGATVGDASDVLEPQMHSRDPSTTYGIRNLIGYSNSQVDKLIRESAGILKIDERREALEKTMAILMEDLPWIPLYIDQDVYALENAYEWKPRHDSNVFAFEIGLRR